MRCAITILTLLGITGPPSGSPRRLAARQELRRLRSRKRLNRTLYVNSPSKGRAGPDRAGRCGGNGRSTTTDLGAVPSQMPSKEGCRHRSRSLARIKVGKEFGAFSLFIETALRPNSRESIPLNP